MATNQVAQPDEETWRHARLVLDLTITGRADWMSCQALQATPDVNQLRIHRVLSPDAGVAANPPIMKGGPMAEGDVETYYEDGAWKNRSEGNQRASGTYNTKAEAQGAGRDLAIRRGVEHIIKNKDGQIGQRNTYPRSRDPRKSKG